MSVGSQALQVSNMNGRLEGKCLQPLMTMLSFAPIGYIY
jgi:hypothetical protein